MTAKRLLFLAPMVSLAVENRGHDGSRAGGASSIRRIEKGPPWNTVALMRVERDSNSRRLGLNGFQDRLLRPLGHLPIGVLEAREPCYRHPSNTAYGGHGRPIGNQASHLVGSITSLPPM